MFGDQVEMYVTIKKLQVRLPQEYGFPTPLLASLIVQELTKWVPTEAIDEVVCRQNDTATFMCHADYVHTLLRASGRNGMFIKDKDDTTEYCTICSI